MINLAPFESSLEHSQYCDEAGVAFEDGAVGFKIFSETEKLGLCQLKFVGEAAYILALADIDSKISVQMLANVFTSVIEFLKRVEVSSVIYPIQNENDVTIAEAIGFDKISETLYVFDFSVNEEEHHHCDEDCHHHHSH